MIAKRTASRMTVKGGPFGIAMKMLFSKLARDQVGATAIEYALIASFISIAAYTVFVSIGTSVSGVFSKVANGF